MTISAICESDHRQGLNDCSINGSHDQAMFFAKIKQTHFARLFPFVFFPHSVICTSSHVCMWTASKTSISNIKYIHIVKLYFEFKLFKVCHWTHQQRRRVFLTRFCGSFSTWFFNLSRQFPMISRCAVSAMMQVVSFLIFYILDSVLSELRSAWKGCCQVHFKARQW